MISGFDSLGALMYFRQPLNNTSDIPILTPEYKDEIPNKDYKLQILWTGTTLDNNEIQSLGDEVNATTV